MRDTLNYVYDIRDTIPSVETPQLPIENALAIPITYTQLETYKNHIKPKNPELFYRHLMYTENLQLIDTTYFLHTRGAESYYRPKYSICPDKITYAFIPDLSSLDKLQTFLPIDIQDFLDKSAYKLEHIGIFNHMTFPVMFLQIPVQVQAANFQQVSNQVDIALGGVSLLANIQQATSYNSVTDFIVQAILELITQCRERDKFNQDLDKNNNYTNQPASHVDKTITNISAKQTRIIRTWAGAFYNITTHTTEEIT